MARSLSEALQRDINSASGTAPVLLLEIDHPDLPTPIRVCQDTQSIVSNGELYQALAFDCLLPDDLERQLPVATLAIDNIGREISDWIEASGGGQGATARLMIVRRDDPDVVEWEVTMDLTNTHMDQALITGRLGFDNLLAQPGCALSYRPDVAPGLY